MPTTSVKSSKGFDIPVLGVPSQIISDAHPVGSVALLGADYIGLEPKMRVAIGDHVTLGQPLFHHKADPAVVFTAPASGIVTSIHRGERRVLKSVVIDLDPPMEANPTISGLGTDRTPETVRAKLLDTGLWTAFRTRPFSRIPASDAIPASIFVTACDTRPLAADPTVIVDEESEAFVLGLDLVAGLASGPTYLCTGVNWAGPVGTDPSIEHVLFDGPHPSGLPGTHIHHLDPVGPEHQVWHIGYQDIIAVGKLFGEGRIWSQRLVALGGAGFASPRLVRTQLGADIAALTEAELATPDQTHDTPRLLSGCVLSGRVARGTEAYLGRYHLQVSAVPQMRPQSWRNTRPPNETRFSFANLLARWRHGGAGSQPSKTVAPAQWSP